MRLTFPNMDYFEDYKNSVNKLLLKFIKDSKVEMEAEGYIPTLDLLIERMEERIV